MSGVLALLIALAPAQDAAAQDWPQWRGPRRDGTWTETGLVERFGEDGLRVSWRAPIGAGYSGPTVAGGRVFVTDRIEDAPEEIAGGGEVERVLAFDAASGAALWSHAYAASYDGISYKAGPRCSVLVDGGRAFGLGAVGHLFALAPADGAVLWQRDLRAEYEAELPVWGLAAAPIVEGGLLIVPASGKDACLVALDPATGEERWRALPDRGNYAAPIVVEQAGRRVLVAWTGDRVVGVAPESGELLWAHDFAPKRMPLGIATPVVAPGAGGDRLFLSGFYDGSLMLRLSAEELAVEQVWRRIGQNERSTDALHCMIGTPIVRGDHVYGVDAYGELRCLRLSDGERVWTDLTAVPSARWATIHMVQNGEDTWMLNERGELLVGRLSPEGFRERSRAKLIEPTRGQLNQRDGVIWSHPAFAGKHVFARNDLELVCADLSAPERKED